MPNQLDRILRQCPCLLRLRPDIDLDQHRQTPTRPVLGQQILEPVGNFGSIERVNEVEDLEGGAGLVALQRTDKVPSRSVHGRLFRHRFLDPVLAKIDGSSGNRLCHNLRRKGLANRNQCDRIGVAIACRRSSGNTSPDFCQPFSKFRGHVSTVDGVRFVPRQDLPGIEDSVAVLTIDDLFHPPDPLLEMRTQGEVAE